MLMYANMDHIIDSIRTCFLDNQDIFEGLVIKMFGVLDQNESRSTLDRELGDRILSLNQAVRDYDKSVKRLHALIQYASYMTKTTPHLQDRIKGLLQKSRFANTLFELICTLGFPERAYSTFVRAATSNQSFAHLTIYTKPNVASQKQGRSITSARTSSAPSTVPDRARKAVNTVFTPPSQTETETVSTSPSQRETQFPQKPPQSPLEFSQSPRSSLQSDRPELLKQETMQEMDTLTVLRPYLAGKDPLLNPTAIKHDAIQLLNAVLNRNLLQVSTSAWYRFGFVTARNEEEERQIGGLYAAVLKDAPNKTSIFGEIVHAIGTNTMVKLFDTNGWGHFGRELPQLEVFLKAPPHQRPTVWRLKQFLQSEGDHEPQAVLQRDYGFKLCKQREEVACLKCVYAQMLAHLGPIKLHHACLYGRLYDTARQRGVPVDPKYKRLMVNDYPSPCIGFDNDEGLAAYRGKFNKRTLQNQVVLPTQLMSSASTSTTI
jgi:hypothetical protein